MKNILLIALVISIILTAAIIVTDKPMQPNEYNTEVKTGNIISEDKTIKILKVELYNEEGKSFEDYEYYIYYYFENDLLNKEERVYIFDTEILANEYYANILEKEKYILDRNMVIKNIETPKYVGDRYSDILEIIKKDMRVIGYSEQFCELVIDGGCVL